MPAMPYDWHLDGSQDAAGRHVLEANDHTLAHSELSVDSLRSSSHQALILLDSCLASEEVDASTTLEQPTALKDHRR